MLTSQATLADKQAAYKHIEKYLDINKDSVIMIDANARAAILLGLETDAPTNYKQSAQCFKNFLDDNNMYSPSLEEPFAKDCQHTWTSSSYFQHTIDYIVFPKHWRPGSS